jgi:hypothetical protein
VRPHNTGGTDTDETIRGLWATALERFSGHVEQDAARGHMADPLDRLAISGSE